MTEDEALGWSRRHFPADTVALLQRFAGMVVDENARQNLISPATVTQLWSRHIVDSLQLVGLAGKGDRWLDIGTGGGFPGMVLAIATGQPILLVEPRRKRANFLTDCAEALTLSNVTVAAARVEQVQWPADVITARAVASVEKLLLAASHCATTQTRWLLPRGSVDEATLAFLSDQHQLVFHVEQSLTHPDSSILVITGRAA